ncbi:MAG: hypothetical protein B9S32_01815 [Verrucomicrobia bacterium Tous-C9LFEB]|nr:MAG: hypothetical protein B9S32_01815 [Verrucomicrobia bacterium Tous-C9LFEB]
MEKNLESYRIGVIADTHNRWEPSIADHFKGVNEIWHLGDICKESILDELRAISPKLEVVLGNNDFTLNYPYTRQLERCGESFHLVHIQPARIPPGTNWLLFGHTHRQCNVMEGAVHFFNPGSAGKANKGAPASVGMLTSTAGQPFQAEIILL